MKKSALAAFVAAGSALFAAEPETATNGVASTTNILPTVVVEASRLGKAEKEIPAHVEVITKSDIDHSGAQSVVDVLEKRANLGFHTVNANPLVAQVAMRGYGANSFGRVKILVDGEELNNADMSAQELMRVPVRSVERIEVLHGPQTVLHGGDASAGVINIITDADSYERHTSLEVYGGSNDTIGFNAGTRGGFESLGLTYFADVGYEHSDGFRQNSQYEIWSVKGGIRQHFENGSWAAINAFWADSQYGLPGGIGTIGNWKDLPYHLSETPYSRTRNKVYGLNASAHLVIAEDQYVDAKFSARHRTNVGTYTDYDCYTYLGSLKYLNENDLAGFGNRFTVGTDLKYDTIVALASGNKNSYDRFTAALFADEEFFLTDWLSLEGGVRGEAFSSRNRFLSGSYWTPSTVDSGDRGKFAADIALNFRPVDDLKLYAKWSRFYHAPLADEMFSNYGTPNVNLAPEYGWSAEAGVDWTIVKDVDFKLSLYHMELEKEIMYLNYANVNAPDSTERNGFDVSLAWSRDKVGSAGIMYSYVESRFTDGQYKDNLLPMVPRQQLRLFGEVYLWEELSVNGGYRFVGRQRYDSDFANEGGMLPDYGIFDLGVRYAPEWGFMKGFVFSFTVDNLFNKRYSDYAGYYGWGYTYTYPAAGRSYMFSIRYEF